MSLFFSRSSFVTFGAHRKAATHSYSLFEMANNRRRNGVPKFQELYFREKMADSRHRRTNNGEKSEASYTHTHAAPVISLVW